MDSTWAVRNLGKLQYIRFQLVSPSHSWAPNKSRCFQLEVRAADFF